MNPQLPECIGRYRVLAFLGHGAMGNVFLAEDPRLKRQLAIKVVRPQEGNNDEALVRFNREAEISAQLNHPNIITIFDVGEDSATGAFLAMEYVKGTSLAALIKERRLDTEAGMSLLIQAQRALQAAADAGIVHRDVKPENILVSETGRLKLMDFGLARGENNRLTATGVFLGTPAFTAPELLLGKEPTIESDRYAFFVTAFELVLGELPYKGDTMGVTLYRIVNEAPAIPEGTPSALGEVFGVALAKNPEQRFQDLPSFMAALIRAVPLPDEVRSRLLGMVEGDAQQVVIRSPRAQTPASPHRENEPTQILTTPQKVVQPPELKRNQRASMPSPSPRATPRLPRITPRAPQAAERVRSQVAVPVIKPILLPLPAPRARVLPLGSSAPSPLPVTASDNGSGFHAVPPSEAPEAPQDPFQGIDWDQVLRIPENGAEGLVQELEDDLAAADVLGAEERAEQEEVTQEIDQFGEELAALELPDMLRAEDRAEGEDLLRALEQDLAVSEPLQEPEA